MLGTPDNATVALLNYLLPGLLVSGIVQALTSMPRLSPFDRVVHALMYTLLVRAGVVMLTRAVAGSVGGVGATEPAASVLVSIVLGLAITWIINRDKLHWLLRRLRLTNQSSHPGELHAALHDHTGYSVLHVGGERRLFGIISDWPSTPGEGHFVVTNASWLTDSAPVVLENVARVVVRASDVERVEVMSGNSSTQVTQPQ